MKNTVPIRLGDLIRNKRIAKGLRITDLSDEKISAATISNIERGISASADKVELLIKKVGLTQNEVNNLISDEHEHEDTFLLKLQTIESKISVGQLNKCLAEIEYLQIKESPHLLAFANYLKGKCHKKQRSWEKAASHLQKASEIANDPKLAETNLGCVSLIELGEIRYYQNDVQEAIKVSREALEVYSKTGERAHVVYWLQQNLIYYLTRLGNTHKAYEYLEKINATLDDIKMINIKILLMERSVFMELDRGNYKKALTIVDQGIELSNSNGGIRLLDLWTVKGKVFIAMSLLNKAEDCLLTAVDLSHASNDPYVVIDTYTDLGKLYLKQTEHILAIEKLNKALAYCEQLDDALRYIEVSKTIADCYVEQKQSKEAVDFYKQALNLANKHQYWQQARDILINLTLLQEESNDPNLHENLVLLLKVEAQLKKEGATVYV